MKYSQSNNGIVNEIDFVNYLNDKKVYELNPMFLDFLESLYGEMDKNLSIKCVKNNEPQKSDIFIEVNGIIKRISIKMGAKNSVHVDRITDFIHFLIENKVSREVVIEYLKYHYADGSTNGKGSKRLSGEEYKVVNQEKIDMINKEFCNETLIKKAIKRFVTMGTNSNYEIDAIICGTVNDFFWILKSDIYDVILSKKDIYSSGVHFGSLFCQPMNRCLNYNPLYEKKRFCMQVKWYSLFDDIISIMYKNSQK